MKNPLIATALLLAASPAAHGALVGYDDEAAFAAAATDPITVDFSGGPADDTTIEVSEADGGQQDFTDFPIAFSPIEFGNFTLTVGGSNGAGDEAFVDLPALRFFLEAAGVGHESYTLSFDAPFTSFAASFASINSPTLLTAGNDSLDLANFDTVDEDSFFGFVSDAPISSFTFSAPSLEGTGFERFFIAPVDQSTIPEPASAALLAAGGLLLVRRRRA